MLICMRTTLNLDDRLMKAAKQEAARSGRTLTSVIEDALRSSLAAGNTRTGPSPAKLVISRGAPLPGVDLDNSAALLDLMEADASV